MVNIPSGLIREILDREYGIKMGKVLKRTEGLSNYHVIAKTSIGQITVRWSKLNNMTASDIDFEALVTGFYYDQGLPVRRTVKTAAGKNFVSVNNTLLTVLYFVPGDYPKNLTFDHVNAAAGMLRRLHDTGRSFDTSGIGQELMHKKTIRLEDRLLESINRFKNSPVEAALRHDWLAKASEIDPTEVKSLDSECTLIHGDYNPSNFTFTGDRMVGIFDFEHAGFGSIYCDLGLLVSHYWAYLLSLKPLCDVTAAVSAGYGLSTVAELRNLGLAAKINGLWFISRVVCDRWENLDEEYFKWDVAHHHNLLSELFKQLKF